MHPEDGEKLERFLLRVGPPMGLLGNYSVSASLSPAKCMCDSKIKAGLQNTEIHYFAPLSTHRHMYVFAKLHRAFLATHHFSDPVGPPEEPLGVAV